MHLVAIAVTLFSILVAYYFHQNSSHRSVVMQVVKYFSRAHNGIVPTDKIKSRATWTADYMINNPNEWQFNLSKVEAQELQEAVTNCLFINKSTKDLNVKDFPLPLLSSNITEWRKALDPQTGLGVVVIHGIPVSEMIESELHILWWGIGLHLGIPGAQNGKGELLGIVTDEFRNLGSLETPKPGSVRQYRTAEAIHFHCDPADVVGLLCVQSAGGGGGRSRIASSVSVFNELLDTRPDLAPLLFQQVPLDVRGDAGVNWIYIQPSAYYGGVLKTFWHSEYFRTAYSYNNSATTEMPSRLKELVDIYDSIVNDPKLFVEMEFAEGDIQFISNHVVVHSRTAIEDTDVKQRKLLRLWLSLPVSVTADVHENFSIMKAGSRYIYNYLWSLINKSLNA